ncbi:serine hydrolase [Streptomyces sp. ST2-7A]|uniref:serine hydrolase n=1 Tax=Streptomyces sp. ST2-7A TaxID=2907214 RepID=UPI001F2DB474|nr:serine hydrolase [Streptomyces sp. ST2-7A]MCE7082524.1 class A beta-lactamase-related serine hydrolase [Streptomyces sp. ST2-7A]
MTTDRLVAGLRAELREGGLTGSFLVRDLRTGEEVGIDPDLELPIASLAKVPLALATVDRVRRGEIDGAHRITVDPTDLARPTPTGLGRFRHPARIAVDDLVHLAVAISDNVAADTLFALTPPDRVTASLRAHGLRGITVRHTIGELNDTPAERLDTAEVHLAHVLAIDAGTRGRGHLVPQLDVSRANSGTARAFTDLLEALWTPPADGSGIHPATAARVREVMGDNLLRQRLAPDFVSDSARWSSKTGTLLNLRHEVGVVEHTDGGCYAVAALTESGVPAGAQPDAEALMGRVARALRDHLRGR